MAEEENIKPNIPGETNETKPNRPAPADQPERYQFGRGSKGPLPNERRKIEGQKPSKPAEDKD